MLKRGLHHGDLLSPFFPIMVMEVLHVVVEDVLAVGLLVGAKIKLIQVSNFFYAWNALFFGEWS